MVLVTGATGHLGNVLVRELLARGERVRALVLPEDCSPLQSLNVELVEGDVLAPPSLARAMEQVRVVYHLAGVISIVPGREEWMRRVNVEGVRNVATVALQAGVRRMVHVSSVHAFRRMPHGVVMDESTPLAPDSPAGTYDRTKAEGTLAMLQLIARGLDGVIVCPSGIVGPYDYRGSEMGRTVLDFTRQKVHFLVDGAYDFVDVRDVARGLIAACERGRTGEIYILSGTRARLTSIKAMAQAAAGVHSPHVVVPFGLANLIAGVAERLTWLTKQTPRFTRYALRTVRDNSAFSNAKARRELGYAPRPLEQTIADTVRWWREQRRR